MEPRVPEPWLPPAALPQLESPPACSHQHIAGAGISLLPRQRAKRSGRE